MMKFLCPLPNLGCVEASSWQHSMPLHPPQGLAWHQSAITTSACGEGPSPGCPLATLRAYILPPAAFRSWNQKLKWAHVWRQLGMLGRGQEEEQEAWHALPARECRAAGSPGCSTLPVARPTTPYQSKQQELQCKTAWLLFLPFQAIGSFTNNRDLLLGPSAASLRSKGKPQPSLMSPSR